MSQISGNLSGAARIIIVNESDWSLEFTSNKPSGHFSINGLAPSKKLIIARKLGGETIGFGNVTAVTEV
jgi:hypothetical protein